MPLVFNWASICRNKMVGSVGQNGGNFILTAARVEGWAGVAASWVGCVSAMRAGVSSSDMVTSWSPM